MAYLEATFERGAEIGIVGEGRTLEEAFTAAARALFSVIADLAEVRPTEDVVLSCSAQDPERLLVAWLDALLAAADARHLVFSRFRLRIRDDWHLTGRARGEPLDRHRHRSDVDPKAITLVEPKLTRRPSGWRVEIVAA